VVLFGLSQAVFSLPDVLLGKWFREVKGNEQDSRLMTELRLPGVADGLVFPGFSYPSHPEFAPGLVLELVLDLMAKISSCFPQIAQVLVASRLGVALFRRQLGHGQV